MNQEQYEQMIYLKSAEQWAFLDMGRAWIDDMKAGKLTWGDLPKKHIKQVKQESAKDLGLTKKGKFRQEIDKKICISDLAKEYFPNHEIKGTMMRCPFHDDKDPSLSFSDTKNIFKCWGCGVKGDIVEFYRRILENAD